MGYRVERTIVTRNKDILQIIEDHVERGEVLEFPIRREDFTSAKYQLHELLANAEIWPEEGFAELKSKVKIVAFMKEMKIVIAPKSFKRSTIRSMLGLAEPSEEAIRALAHDIGESIEKYKPTPEEKAALEKKFAHLRKLTEKPEMYESGSGGAGGFDLIFGSEEDEQE